jgi:hypothetical protein
LTLEAEVTEQTRLRPVRMGTQDVQVRDFTVPTAWLTAPPLPHLDLV